MNSKNSLESKSPAETIDEFTKEYIKLVEKIEQLVESLWSLWLQRDEKEVEK